jgi:hypothetical protein
MNKLKFLIFLFLFLNIIILIYPAEISFFKPFNFINLKTGILPLFDKVNVNGYDRTIANSMLKYSSSDDDDEYYDEDGSDGWGYFFAGLIAFPAVLSLSIYYIKINLIGKTQDNYELVVFCMSSTVLGGLGLAGIWIALLVTGAANSDYIPSAIFSTVFAADYFINFMISTGLFAFSKVNYDYYSPLLNDFFQNYFISSAAVFSVFAISMIIFWVLHETAGRSSIKNPGKKTSKVQFGFDGQSISVRF